jgi:hypothetical protein
MPPTVDVDVVDRAILARVLRRVLEDPLAEPLDSAVERLRSGAGQGLVYRLFGDARSRGEHVPWSAILKILQATREGRPDGWRHPDREVLAYRSGVLRELPGGLAARGASR